MVKGLESTANADDGGKHAHEGKHLSVPPMELNPANKAGLLKTAKNKAKEGGIWADPGLTDLIKKTPDARIKLLNQAITEYPQDVRLALTYESDIASGTRKRPKEIIEEELRTNGEFSFCVNPYTGMLLADDIETGHKEILEKNGVVGDTAQRFILGAIQTEQSGEKHIFFKEITPKKGLTQDDQRRISKDVLVENGLPTTINKEVSVETTDNKTASTCTRGQTPRGAMIPLWNHSDPGSGVVFEDGYTYTSYPVNTEGGIHPRFAMSMNRATEGAGPFEVYKNTETGVGHYVNNDLPVLVDDLKLSTTGPDHRLIIRAHSRHGEIPAVMDRIATWTIKSRITKELSKGD